MKSAPFRAHLGEIRDTKKRAIGELIKGALAAGVTVHIAAPTPQHITTAWQFLAFLGFERKTEESLGRIKVHPITEPIPSEDLGINIYDIVLPS